MLNIFRRRKLIVTRYFAKSFPRHIIIKTRGRLLSFECRDSSEEIIRDAPYIVKFLFKTQSRQGIGK